MESDSIKALSEYRFEKALSNIAIAKTLNDSGEYDFALNRAYYTCLKLVASTTLFITITTAINIIKTHVSVCHMSSAPNKMKT